MDASAHEKRGETVHTKACEPSKSTPRRSLRKQKTSTPVRIPDSDEDLVIPEETSTTRRKYTVNYNQPKWFRDLESFCSASPVQLDGEGPPLTEETSSKSGDSGTKRRLHFDSDEDSDYQPSRSVRQKTSVDQESNAGVRRRNSWTNGTVSVRQRNSLTDRTVSVRQRRSTTGVDQNSTAGVRQRNSSTGATVSARQSQSKTGIHQQSVAGVRERNSPRDKTQESTDTVRQQTSGREISQGETGSVRQRKGSTTNSTTENQGVSGSVRQGRKSRKVSDGQRTSAHIMLRMTHDILEQANNVVVDRAHEHNFVRRWLAANPVNGNDGETEGRWKQMRSAVQHDISMFLRGNDFSLYANRPGGCRACMSRRLSVRIIQVMQPICLEALRIYRTGITADPLWYWLERNQNVATGEVRAPFDMVADEKNYSCLITDEQIFVVGKEKLKPKTKTSWTFTSQISTSGRAMLHALKIHIMNWLGFLMNRVIEVNAVSDAVAYAKASEVLRVTHFEDDIDGNPTCQYETHNRKEKFFHEQVWNELRKTLDMDIMRALVTELVEHAPAGHCELIIPASGSARRLLKHGHQVSSEDILRKLTDGSSHSVDFMRMLVRFVGVILTNENVLTVEQFNENNPPVGFRVGLEEFVTSLYTIILRCHEDEDAPVNLRLTRLQKVCRIFHTVMTITYAIPPRPVTGLRLRFTLTQPSTGQAPDGENQREETDPPPRVAASSENERTPMPQVEVPITVPESLAGTGTNTGEEGGQHNSTDVARDKPPEARGATTSSLRRTEPSEAIVISDEDEIRPVLPAIPVASGGRNNTAQDKDVRECYMCDRAWPKLVPWPPSAVRYKNGKKITIHQDDEIGTESIAARTRQRLKEAGDPSIPVAPPVDNILDAVESAEGRTAEERIEKAAEIMTEVFKRSSDLPGIFDRLQQVVNQKRTEHEEEVARLQAEATRKEELRQRNNEKKNREREERAAQNERNRQTAQQRKEAKQQQQTQDNTRKAQSVKKRNRQSAAQDSLTDHVQSVVIPNTKDQVATEVIQQEDRPYHIHYWIPQVMSGRDCSASILASRNVFDFLSSVSQSDYFDQQFAPENRTMFRTIAYARGQYPQNYVEQMPISFHTLTDYCLMWKTILLNDCEETIARYANNEDTWQFHSPTDLIRVINRGNGYGTVPGINGFRPASIVNELNKPRTIEFGRALNDGETVSVRDNQFREGELVTLTGHGVESVQGGRVRLHPITVQLAVVTGKSYFDTNDGHQGISYKATIIGDGSGRGPNGEFLRRQPLPRNLKEVVLSVRVLQFLGSINRSLSAIHSLQTSSNVATGRFLTRLPPVFRRVLYGQQNESLCRPEATHFRQTVTSMTPNSNTTLTVDEAIGFIERTHRGILSVRFRQYLREFYVGVAPPGDGECKQINCLNENQTMAVADSLFDRTMTPDDNEIRQRFRVVVGPPGTGKTTAIMHMIGVRFIPTNNMPDLHRDAFRFEEVRQAWEAAQGRDRNPIIEQLFDFTRERFPRILLVTPTNNAMEVLEDRLLRGIPVLHPDGDWRYIFPPYRLVRNEFHTGTPSPLQRENIRRRTLRYPDQINRNFASCITITTLGSCYRAFQTRNKVPQPYDLIIVDEASQASDADFFPLFKELFIEYRSANIPIPKVVLVGDPRQLGAVVTNSDTTLSFTKSLSLLERLAPTSTGVAAGRNCVSTVILNRQYRMQPRIFELANLISARDVQTSVPAGRRWLQALQYDNAMMYCNNFNPIPNYFIHEAGTWFDPYAADPIQFDNDEFRRVQALANAGGIVEEQSALEAYVVCQILRWYTPIIHFQMSDILVISSYNSQCNLIRRTLLELIPQYFNNQERRGLLNSRVSTVYGAQGSEAWVVIYSPGKAPIGNNPQIGPRSNLQNPRELYTVMTRAKQHLYFVGSARLFRTAPIWDPVINRVCGAHVGR